MSNAAAIARRVEQRFHPKILAAAVAVAFGRRLPMLEERVFRKDGVRIATTLARVYA